MFWLKWYNICTYVIYSTYYINQSKLSTHYTELPKCSLRLNMVKLVKCSRGLLNHSKSQITPIHMWHIYIRCHGALFNHKLSLYIATKRQYCTSAECNPWDALYIYLLEIKIRCNCTTIIYIRRMVLLSP